MGDFVCLLWYFSWVFSRIFGEFLQPRWAKRPFAGGDPEKTILAEPLGLPLKVGGGLVVVYRR